MYSVISTAINYGLNAVPVKVEADVSEGLPCFEMVGFLSSEVREARERVRTALKNSGYPIPPKRITINLTPANIRKSGTAFDLPVAAAVLAAMGILDEGLLSGYIVIGEVSLNGTILPVSGVLSVAILAKESGCEGIIVSEKNAREASIISGLKVIAVSDMEQFIRKCGSGFPETEVLPPVENVWETSYTVDFSEIYGQKILRRACEIAVSGMHNLLMIGPPGSGKTMTARRLPTILPDLTKEEKLELSQIYSICDLLDEKRIIRNERPFRTPHHTSTPQSIAGGGKFPHPGEISLAHHGILFLDELPEFSPRTLEVLREPLEEKQIHISRLDANVTYPADFILTASMNPCPCGYFPDRSRCSCSPNAIHNYVNRISQALLDRIDLCVETQEISWNEMQNREPSESSAEIRKRVERTHTIQQERYRTASYRFNSQIPGSDLEVFCTLDAESSKRMAGKYEEYRLSARTYSKILKIARTIADMEEAETIRWKHLEEAFLYRSPNKKYWRC
ncbi:MAG: YifB family Mg chelatase-like AAA ATPase [Lachnospiraceae bacterium]|nr:YifB family Mg chelatase-like AAA ATPase [Lachnospiraceae bacterium]